MPVRLSKNFTLDEFTQSDTAECNPDIAKEQFFPPDDVIERLRFLCENAIEPLRTLLDIPLYISSGYRCSMLNKTVGGSPSSQHLTGEAADVVIPDRMARNKAFYLAKEQIQRLSIEIIGKPFRKDVNANFYLFAAACLNLNELNIDQLIHEFGSFGRPAWIHISASVTPREAEILVLPDRKPLTLEEALLLGC